MGRIDRDFQRNRWDWWRGGNQGSHKVLCVLPPAVEDFTASATNAKRKPVMGSMELEVEN